MLNFLRKVFSSLRWLVWVAALVLSGYYLLVRYKIHPEHFTNAAVELAWYAHPMMLAMVAGFLMLIFELLLVAVNKEIRKQNNGVLPPTRTQAKKAAKDEKKKTIIWSARRRTAIGLPLTLTKYSLDTERLYLQTGFFNTTEDEIRLYRITDITFQKSLGQKLLGMGTIHCDSSDATMRNFDIKNIKHPKDVKDMLSKLVDESRIRNRVFTSEAMNNPPHHGEWEQPIPPLPEIDRTDIDGNGIPDMLEKG